MSTGGVPATGGAGSPVPTVTGGNPGTVGASTGGVPSVGNVASGGSASTTPTPGSGNPAVPPAASAESDGASCSYRGRPVSNAASGVGGLLLLGLFASARRRAKKGT